MVRARAKDQLGLPHNSVHPINYPIETIKGIEGDMGKIWRIEVNHSMWQVANENVWLSKCLKQLLDWVVW